MTTIGMTCFDQRRNYVTRRMFFFPRRECGKSKWIENRTKEECNISKCVNSSCPSSKSTSTHHRSSHHITRKRINRFRKSTFPSALSEYHSSIYSVRLFFLHEAYNCLHETTRFNYFAFLITVMQIHRYSYG